MSFIEVIENLIWIFLTMMGFILSIPFLAIGFVFEFVRINFFAGRKMYLYLADYLENL